MKVTTIAAVTLSSAIALAAVTAAGGVGAGVAEARSRTVLTLATYGDAVVEGPLWEQIKAAFEKQYPQYELRVQITPYVDYISKLTTQLAGGQPPDVFQTWAQNKPSWVQKGILMDLTGRVKASKLANLDEFIPPARQSVQYQGKTWGTPFDFGSMLWFANVDLLDQAGLPVPGMRWTTKDLEQDAKKISQPEKGVYGTLNPVGWAGLDNLQWTYNWTGHYWLTPDNKDVAVDDAGTAAMLQYWYNLVWRDKATPPPTTSLQAGQDQWSGNVGLWGGWLSSFQQLDEMRQKKEEAGNGMFHWTVLPFPAGPKAQNNFAQGHMWSIAASNRHPDDAWKLTEWLASRSAEEIFVRNRRIQPMRADERLWDAWLSFLPAKQQPQLKAWILKYLYGSGIAKNFDYWPSYNEMAAAIGPHLYNIFVNQKPIENEMKAAAQEMRTVLAKQSKPVQQASRSRGSQNERQVAQANRPASRPSAAPASVRRSANQPTGRAARPLAFLDWILQHLRPVEHAK